MTQKEAPPITPAQRIGNLIHRMGKLQAQAGLVLRYGPQIVAPEEKDSGATIAVKFLEALLEAKDALALVEQDIAQAVAATRGK